MSQTSSKNFSFQSINELNKNNRSDSNSSINLLRRSYSGKIADVSISAGSANSDRSEKSAKTGSLFQKSFKLLDELGRGAYGFVYRCINQKTRRVYAVKFNINPADMSSMKQEYYTIAEICFPSGHPNIVNVLGSISDDRIVYNIFELASGGDLSTDLNEKGYYTEQVAADIIRQVFLGVDYIHSRGFLHRDIKPQNLLILKTSYLHIKITDFGLSVHRKKGFNEKQPDSIVSYIPWEHGYAGTESYICPEILKNSHYDYECDVWSCGVVLYELLAGYVPFDEVSCLDVEHQFLMPEWRGLDEAKDLINRIFDRNVPYRLTVVDALNHAFLTKQVLHRQLKPDMSNAMTHYQGMKMLKEEFVKLIPNY